MLLKYAKLFLVCVQMCMHKPLPKKWLLCFQYLNKSMRADWIILVEMDCWGQHLCSLLDAVVRIDIYANGLVISFSPNVMYQIPNIIHPVYAKQRKKLKCTDRILCIFCLWWLGEYLWIPLLKRQRKVNFHTSVSFLTELKGDWRSAPHRWLQKGRRGPC